MSDVVFNLDNYTGEQVAAIRKFQEVVSGFQEALSACANANVPLGDALAFAGIEIPSAFMPLIESALSNVGSATGEPSPR